MKQLALLLTFLVLMTAIVSAQDSTQAIKKDSSKPVTPTDVRRSTGQPIVATKPKKDWSKVHLDRANDHFMAQIAYDGWASTPDTIRTRKGFSHSVNVYVMMDFPFKTDARFSVGLGLGVSGTSQKFDNQEPNIIAQTTQLPFTDYSGTNTGNHFKKFKLVSTYIEVPVELRLVQDPEHSDKSWKAAIGLKAGLLANVHTRGKTLVNAGGSTINNYTQKVSSKTYFNSTRLAGTARIGYGHVSLFGQYSITSFIKDGRGPDIHPFSIGLTFSGL